MRSNADKQITDPVIQSGPAPHPRTLGWLGTTALALGGSNSSLFLVGVLITGQGAIHGQGSAAVPLLTAGLVLALMAAPGWLELVLMWPNRVGGIAATCAEAFRPISPVLANLAGTCYWWGWAPNCGLSAILIASALHQWYLPRFPVTSLAVALVLILTAVNLLPIRTVVRIIAPTAVVTVLLALLAGLVPVWSGHVDWHQAFDYHLTVPFPGPFGKITSLMAGLYLVGFGVPAFETATCHVGETVNPARNVPRAIFASALAAVFFVMVLPTIWLGVLGTDNLAGDLTQTLGPAFAPLVGSTAKAMALGFMVLNMFHAAVQPLAGMARTLAQLAEDGLLPAVFARRSRNDTPWVSVLITSAMSILFLLIGNPLWLVAAANLTYLISLSLPSVAVWLLRRDAPDHPRLWRAPDWTIGLGLVAAAGWLIATVFGFEQFGLPTVVAGIGLAYSGTVLFALRRWQDRRLTGIAGPRWTLHTKLTGAMLLVMALDSIGYLLAAHTVSTRHPALIAVLADIFVAVALLTITVGLVLPGIIAHAAEEVSHAASRLATGTLADFSRAMAALGTGDLDAAHARLKVAPIRIRSHDEVGAMAASFNAMQEEVVRAAIGLDGAREGLRNAHEGLERRVEERTQELRQANTALHDANSALHNANSALHNANYALHDANARLENLATTDPLTGLPNHRAMITALDMELERAARFNRSCALLFLDIDHFKALNDGLGHGAGDAALSEFGAIVGKAIRGIDQLGRWGGEEFVVVLPETDREGAMIIAEAVREEIASRSFHACAGHLTCSVGVALFPEDAGTRSSLLAAADSAMYAAKHLGRNQVRSIADPAVKALNTSDQISSREEAVLQGEVEALALLVAARDQYTGQHTDMVAALSVRLALAMGQDAQVSRMVGLVGQLHDVGKVAVPDAVLQKAGRLTDKEWQIMHQHPVVGADVVGRMPSLRVIAPAVRGHHERWDGNGYPDGLIGTAIPLAARIVAVADAYGAMTTDRPYRQASSHAWTMTELCRCAGHQFDPAVVEALTQMLSEPTSAETVHKNTINSEDVKRITIETELLRAA